jgi:hypothetical protein
LGAGIILGHRGSDALKFGAGVDGSAFTLRMNIQNNYTQKPLSVRLGVLRSVGRYDAAFGLDVFFDAILDVVGERLASVETGKQRGACDWRGGDAGPNNAGMNVGGTKKCCERQQNTNDAPI